MTVWVVIASNGRSAWVEGVGRTKRAGELIVKGARENAQHEEGPTVVFPPVECEVRYA